jgi:hypothetical protein
VLEEIIPPSFDQLITLEKKKKILDGGLPAGDRAFVFIAETSSNEELDQMLRKLPMWGSLDWEVTALQTFAGSDGVKLCILVFDVVIARGKYNNTKPAPPI